MVRYARHAALRAAVTPQSEAIPGTAQVPNSAGGYAFAIDDFARLDRFLILGTDGGTYYAGEREITIENAECVKRCLAADGVRTVARIVQVSQAGRAPKNDPAIFALAMACASPDAATKRAALGAVPAVCRIGTHLFQFIGAVEAMRGWGRGLKRAVAQGWYGLPPVEKVAFQAIKYKQREGWSHRDALRLAHPILDSVVDDARRALFEWVTHPERMREDGVIPVTRRTAGKKTLDASGQIRIEHPRDLEPERFGPLPPVIVAATKLARAPDAGTAAELIRAHDLPRECVPTQYLDDHDVWAALLEDMPPTAMIRNLGKMSSIGFLKFDAPGRIATVVDKLRDRQALKRARVHPLQILIALKTYAQGHGDKGKLQWIPVPTIVDALNDAFYLAFDAIEPTGKRRLLALDVSGSMEHGSVAGSSLTPREGTAALALVAAKTEASYLVVGFCSGGSGLTGGWRGTGGRRPLYAAPDGITPLPITAGMRLNDAVQLVSNLPFGGTDCALPMLYAQACDLQVDSFEIFTDNETWAGHIHPVQALAQYRTHSGIPAKLVVTGMTATRFSIANPDDPGMLDVVGFDTAAPNVIADFVRG